MIASTRPRLSVSEPTLFVAFDLGKREWKMAVTSGFGVTPWVRTVASGDLAAVARVVREGRRRFGVPAAARVESCYEAGRGGGGVRPGLTRVGLGRRGGGAGGIGVERRGRRGWGRW